jgi:hypothetical protein
VIRAISPRACVELWARHQVCELIAATVAVVANVLIVALDRGEGHEGQMGWGPILELFARSAGADGGAGAEPAGAASPAAATGG